MTLYTPLHTTVRRHPKVMRAARALGVSIPAMIGHLSCLWTWTIEYEPSGTLRGYSNAEIADAAAWDGDANLFVGALLNCGGDDRAGLLDVDERGTLYVHDWQEYGGKISRQNGAHNDYQKRHRALYGDSALTRAVQERDGNNCRYCGKIVNWHDRRSMSGATYDHVDPDGPNTLENIVVACYSCNSSKRHRTPEQAGMHLLPLASDLQVTCKSDLHRIDQTRVDQTREEANQSRVLAIASVAPADAGRSVVRFTTTDESAPDAAQATPKRASKKREPGVSVLTQAQRAEFDRWWPTYPREKRGSRKLAEEQWARKNPDGARTDAIIASTEQHKLGRKFQDGYAWEAFRFLRDEHWLDEVEPVRSACAASASASDDAPRPIRVMSDRSRENLRLLLAAENVEIGR